MANESHHTIDKDDSPQQILEQVLSIIDDLSEKHSNVKLHIQDLKFNVGNSKIVFNSQVNFDFDHTKEQI